MCCCQAHPDNKYDSKGLIHHVDDSRASQRKRHLNIVTTYLSFLGHKMSLVCHGNQEEAQAMICKAGILDAGSWILDAPSCYVDLNPGYGIQEPIPGIPNFVHPGSWFLVPGFRLQDP